MEEENGGRDESLVADHLRGDPGAFREIYERYRDRVYATSYRILGDAEEAGDVTQNVFVKIHEELRKFRFRSRFSTWLYRVSVNHAINRANERERHRRIRERIARTEGGTLKTAGASSPPKFDERVQRAVGRLSPKLRAIVALRYLEGLSYEEVAGVLEISIGTVKSRLFLAHETLRPLLHGIDEEE